LRKVTVTVQPYATQWGTIDVPDEIRDYEDVYSFVEDHFDEIEFGSPELDYEGIDMDIEDPDEDLTVCGEHGCDGCIWQHCGDIEICKTEGVEKGEEK